MGWFDGDLETDGMLEIDGHPDGAIETDGMLDRVGIKEGAAERDGALEIVGVIGPRELGAAVATAGFGVVGLGVKLGPGIKVGNLVKKNEGNGVNVGKAVPKERLDRPLLFDLLFPLLMPFPFPFPRPFPFPLPLPLRLLIPHSLLRLLLLLLLE